MHHAFDPETARSVADDRVARLRHDRLEPLHTLAPWRTGTPTSSGGGDGMQTVSPDCRTTRTPASVS